jgi:AP-3 complex subunit beta
LTEIIQDLLGDKQTTVLGSVVCAFNEVCPERLDLIHPHYRKLCNLLADIEEWGQIAIINLLTRYGRSQFANPDPDKVSFPPSGSWREGKEVLKNVFFHLG